MKIKMKRLALEGHSRIWIHADTENELFPPLMRIDPVDLYQIYTTAMLEQGFAAVANSCPKVIISSSITGIEVFAAKILPVIPTVQLNILTSVVLKPTTCACKGK
jgi:hypothetical protein